MREISPEFQASLERGLTKLFTSYPESIWKIFSFREILQAQRQALEERKRNAVIQAKREDLSLLLESKFGSLSEEIVSQLSAVRNVEELDRLFRRALNAQTLDEVGIPEGNNA